MRQCFCENKGSLAVNPLTTNVPHHIETSQLIFIANQFSQKASSQIIDTVLNKPRKLRSESFLGMMLIMTDCQYLGIHSHENCLSKYSVSPRSHLGWARGEKIWVLGGAALWEMTFLGCK